jgi:hypothetical protein
MKSYGRPIIYVNRSSSSVFKVEVGVQTPKMSFALLPPKELWYLEM